MAQSMKDLDYSPCQADADVWMRPMIKPDGFEYWEYVLIYVDDILVVSHEPERLMESLSALYRLKEDPLTKKGYGVPKKYLGADIGKFDFPQGGKPAWFMSSDTYVKAAVNIVQTYLSKEN